jgi:formylglycine-generating enzyme required for sulfatase activity
MKKGFLFALLMFPLFSAATQDRGFLIKAAEEVLGTNAVVGKQWAVFIAIDRYREWQPLSNPVRDAKEIRDILTQNYFIDEVIELYDSDATAARIRGLFADLRGKTQNDDSVFVFYAGHGQTDSLTNTGSWIPVDGGKDQLAQSNWLPNIQIRNMLSALPARHVFLVADACFSGDILDTSRGASPVINNEYFRKAYSKVSRQVMTSGASETVPDSSEFAFRFKSTLRRAEGACVDPDYIFTNVREVKTTQPLLGIIRSSEHQEGGSFLFFRKGDYAVEHPAEITAAAPPVSPQERSAAVSVAAVPVQTPNSSGLVQIQGGTFMFGSSNNETGRNKDEFQHRVTLNAFFMSNHEVTQAEYSAIMGVNPSKHKNPQNPVDSVSWFDAVEYCNRLSEKAGLKPAYVISGKQVSWDKNSGGFRLPTEAEWEYACRAGSVSRYNTGDIISAASAAFGTRRPSPAGTFAPNAWGLFDMHGNTAEWCWDWYGEYASRSETNPSGPATGSRKIVRGGSWKDSAIKLRTANRVSASPSRGTDTIGFRVCR